MLMYSAEIFEVLIWTELESLFSVLKNIYQYFFVKSRYLSIVFCFSLCTVVDCAKGLNYIFSLFWYSSEKIYVYDVLCICITVV